MKGFLCVLLIAALCLSMTACIGSLGYEDTNGPDDFTLQSITEQNIIDRDTGTVRVGYSSLSVSHNPGTVISRSCKLFHGVDQVFRDNYPEPTDVSVRVTAIEIKSGNFRLSAIHDGQIIHDFLLTGSNETILFEGLTGEFSIHAAGESASFSFEMEIS